VKRDLVQLANQEFDLLVIGGGIFGACAARDAAERGLRTALIERHDFGGATSSSHLKMIHGGIRYLQHGDLKRLWQSCTERQAWLRTAPHLVRPLPIVVPTYGHGMKGRAALRTGLGLYDALTFGRNRGIADPARSIPRGRTLNRAEALDLFPGLPEKQLTGAGVFCDGQVYNPARLVLAVVQSAAEAGATVANYTEAIGAKVFRGRIRSVQVRDQIGGTTFGLRCRAVLNASGPFADSFLRQTLGVPLPKPVTFSRDCCFVLRRRLFEHDFALAIQGSTHDPDARLSRGARHLFVAPWRDHTLVGVWHQVHDPEPDRVRVTEDELTRYLQEVNQAYPSLELSLDDVAYWNAGLVPFGENSRDEVNLRFGHRSHLIDHAQTGGPDNLLTLIGVRFTTGRIEAEKAVNRIGAKLGQRLAKPTTAEAAVVGGAIPDVAAYTRHARSQLPDGSLEGLADSLTANYGTNFRRVFQDGDGDATTLRPYPGTTTLPAQIRYAIRHEMALTLADVVFRRSDLGTGDYPGRRVLTACAQVAAAELGWSAEQIEEQIREVSQRFLPMRVERRDRRADPVEA
jgi:glycerol-3-phosphate dehydrogenase